jgi:hypothetical protein
MKRPIDATKALPGSTEAHEDRTRPERVVSWDHRKIS